MLELVDHCRFDIDISAKMDYFPIQTSCGLAFTDYWLFTFIFHFFFSSVYYLVIYLSLRASSNFFVYEHSKSPLKQVVTCDGGEI